VYQKVSILNQTTYKVRKIFSALLGLDPNHAHLCFANTLMLLSSEVEFPQPLNLTVYDLVYCLTDFLLQSCPLVLFWSPAFTSTTTYCPSLDLASLPCPQSCKSRFLFTLLEILTIASNFVTLLDHGLD